MEKGKRWRVVGLWRVWDEIPDAPAPSQRTPEALLERVAGVFDHKPTKIEADQAMIAAGTAMRHAFEAREIVGHMVVDENAWTAGQKEGGWLPEGVRRHPRGGRHLHALLAYDIEPPLAKRFWAQAETDRAPTEDVVARLRHLGDAMGLPPVELDSGLPVFADREMQAPQRRRQANRERDGGSLG